MKKILCATLVAALPALAAADTATLNPDRDNTLLQSATGSLSNALGDIFVGRTNQPDAQARRRGVIHFDVAAAIPAGSTINSATLRLWLARTGDTTVRAVAVHRATASWGEGTSYFNGGMGAASTTNDATWIHRFFSATAWTAAGADFAATASGSANAGSSTAVEQWYTWSSAGMTTDVQGWLTTPASNHGWVLVGVESGAMTARRFTSREAVDDTGDHFPELIIDYTRPGFAPEQRTATAKLGGYRVLGERDLDGDGAPDLLLRDDRGALHGGQRTASGLQTWELALDRTSDDPLAIPPR